MIEPTAQAAFARCPRMGGSHCGGSPLRWCAVGVERALFDACELPGLSFNAASEVEARLRHAPSHR